MSNDGHGGIDILARRLIKRIAQSTGKPPTMAAWINIFQRIISSIGVAIEALRVFAIRHNRVRAQEPPHAGQVVAGVVINEAEVVVVLLAGVAAVCKGLAGGGAVGAEGEVAGAAAADHAPAIVITHDAVAAQVVGV